jgi:alginate O-acetyltransferase complex protein AlgI
MLFTLCLAFLGLVRHRRAGKVFLLLASYYFYAFWDWRFLGLILASTLCDWLVGLGLGRARAPRPRRLLLATSLGVNLGLLGFFKYYNFFVSGLAALLAPLGWHPGTLEIVLPVGISFYTFQTLSYTIDVYRGRLAVCRDPLDFALFVGFFPQLVAGPIVRAADFLPQLAAPRRLDWERAFLGFRQFTCGLFKKVFIADRLAVFVDEVFANAGGHDGPTTWLAVLAYAVQIYADFSGYSDMAIGTARWLGFDLRENFDHPYLARSPREFWQRWHISLSTWLRDYLYIPLGGSRRGPRRTWLNLMITMLLGGLWHGAALHFVAWGAWHGLALAAQRGIAARLGGPPGDGRRRLRAAAGWAVTMLVVLVGWVLFRAESFAQALLVLRQMFAPAPGVAWPHPFALLAVALVAGGHVLQVRWPGRDRLLPAAAWTTPVILFLLLWLAAAFPPRGFNPFIYFQF